MTANVKTAIIVGAGPAGLTAAYELLVKTNIKPIIFEATALTGGLAKTINYKGNRIDLGGHRFFSKSPQVTAWWFKFLPLQNQAENAVGNNVMLLRKRLSRIYFLNRFFDYPISLNWQTIKNLGLARVSRVIASCLKSVIAPIRPEKTLEDFFINRFGRELYNIFFKDYTQKVWGVGCQDIGAEWGAQRVKKLSIYKTLAYAVKKKLGWKNMISETTLTEQFFYPKLGPGQFWDVVAAKILELGGEIHTNSEVIGLENCDYKVTAIIVKQGEEIKIWNSDYVFSSMPIKDLCLGWKPKMPVDVFQVGANLQYRDFITVGLLLKKLPVALRDNWIYIQDHMVKLGRLQLFNNWSSALVQDNNMMWLGLEYFCYQGDEFWSQTNEEIIDFALHELRKIFLFDIDIYDGVVIRVPKAYPVYFGAYNNFNLVKEYLNQYDNLFLIGRNGMHRYNNMDHSMLTAMKAVDNIVKNISRKDNIWSVNSEPEYHE